ncbi:oxygen-insensitive NADPH nitroreductase [Bacillaceae bacterium SIJ1]|uniref:oxygen-insensitive NADPH nitroreductase n=1 Tax=Litoribacterium kuwaitense TaxID=1398745 RepID=UPI0013EDDE33|nr:oxygen-insensitive NADPH nitroreductase [Litoribacterium kuwaitense]NGP43561.1 oxygen-insensitive NADPH nitroreductase [Litoribacterium kuwaitense]
MNPTIELLKNHRSVRNFLDKPIAKEMEEAILQSARFASTSSYLQAFTIIIVRDLNKRKVLREVTRDQEYVEKNGLFLVFCADFHKHIELAQRYDRQLEQSLLHAEAYTVGVVDAALAAQNVAIAAESLGLGICYIGGLRNDLHKVSECLNIPSHVVPLFGMSIGHPAKETDKKPRLPASVLFHEDTYQDERIAQIDEYDEIVSDYYQERTKGKRSDSWSDQATQTLAAPKRTYLLNYLQNQGF